MARSRNLRAVFVLDIVLDGLYDSVTPINIAFELQRAFPTHLF